MGIQNIGGGGNSLGRVQQNAGTVINALVPPRQKAYARVSTIRYTAGATPHTLTALRSLGRSKVNAVGAAGQKVVSLPALPGPTGNVLAANDFVAIRETDGATRLYTVASVAGSVVTLTANLVAGVNTTSDLWMFGVPSDTDPLWGTDHPALSMPTGTTTLQDSGDGVVSSNRPDEPILLQSNNITAAGTLELVCFTYTDV